VAVAVHLRDLQLLAGQVVAVTVVREILPMALQVQLILAAVAVVLATIIPAVVLLPVATLVQVSLLLKYPVHTDVLFLLV